MYQKVIQYCNGNNLSVSAFEKLCDLPNGTVYGWKKTDGNPSLNTLLKIAEATNIPVKDWTDGLTIKKGD